MKTILVPTESHEAIRPALETALMLARRFDSYVEGFALRFRVNEFVAVDMAGAIPLESLRDENLEEARRARQIFESFMQRAGGAARRGGTTSLSYGWLDDAPEGEGFVGSYGRVFDVIVMSRPEAEDDRAARAGARIRAVRERPAGAAGSAGAAAPVRHQCPGCTGTAAPSRRAPPRSRCRCSQTRRAGHRAVGEGRERSPRTTGRAGGSIPAAQRRRRRR